MIQQALNGMIAVMLAKFCLNDVPHAASITGITPLDLVETTKKGVRTESEWGEEQYGRKTWASERWARITNGKITLYHGASSYNLPGIIREGLKPSTVGHAYEAEEDVDIAPEEAPTPAVWLAYTPYLAFFFGDVAIEVTIPAAWIAEANDGVLVERHIPPGMIDRYVLMEDWK